MLYERLGPVVGSNMQATHNWWKTTRAHESGMAWIKQGLGLSYKEHGKMQTGLWKDLVTGGWRANKFGTAMGALFVASTISSAYDDYKKDGVLGAATGFVKASALQYGFGAAWGAAGKAIGSGPSKKALIQGFEEAMAMPEPWMPAGPWKANMLSKSQQSLARGLTWGSRAGIGIVGSTLLASAAVFGTVKLAQKAMDWGQARVKRSRTLNMGTPAVDTYGTASTMRMRSLQAIQRSAINGRYALSNEASLIHS